MKETRSCPCTAWRPSSLAFPMWRRRVATTPEFGLTVDEDEWFPGTDVGLQLQIVKAVTRRLPSACGDYAAGVKVIRPRCAAGAPP